MHFLFCENILCLWIVQKFRYEADDDEEMFANFLRYEI